eukprot:CAMPEP_0180117134 /NCGR_PEP_ID=MMETSP0986-20121125/758_1 /TAXON_ID=697907 /ORGANISM="non described non described, Strain CCMP2293" /LENGTH=118 /DNA_ID=CAMNT_0022055991 /DNA_START=284 /DNA_END=640 /DNA_ORIENTATION=-
MLGNNKNLKDLKDGDEGGDDPVLAPLDPAAAVFRTQASGTDPMDVSEEEARAPGGASAPAGSEDCALPDFSEMYKLHKLRSRGPRGSAGAGPGSACAQQKQSLHEQPSHGARLTAGNK